MPTPIARSGPLVVLGLLLLPPTSALTAQQGFIRTGEGTVRIHQSNSAGDNIHLIDPAANRVVAEIDGVPLPHGVSYHPDGGVRPMEFDVGPDGATRYIYVEISGWHGFYVVDFRTREVVRKVKIPARPLSRVDNDALQGSPSHGLVRTPDGRTLWVASNPHDSVYAYSLPELEVRARVAVGHHPDWLVVTPDSRYLYAANAGSNDVSVVDRERMEEIARIPVGHTPKRAHVAVLPGPDPPGWAEAADLGGERAPASAHGPASSPSTPEAASDASPSAATSSTTWTSRSIGSGWSRSSSRTGAATGPARRRASPATSTRARPCRWSRSGRTRTAASTGRRRSPGGTSSSSRGS